MRTLTILALLTGCGWNNLPQQSSTALDLPLWSPDSVVSTPEGLYVSLPHAGGLALLAGPDEAPARVDLGEGRVVGLTVPPTDTAAAIGAVVERYRCDVDDPRDARDIDRISECPSEDLERAFELDLVRDGAVTASIPLGGHFDAIVWNRAGTHAIAWFDLSSAADIDGVVNLTAVTVIDAMAGTASTVSVGFAANNVLFDDLGARAIVLSQSSVAVIDLATSPPTRDVTFSLTLDPDQVVTPVGVALTPDGQYALISAQGVSDLYVLDLLNHSVNIVSLDVFPSAMHVDGDDDRTVFVSSSSPSVDILDHEFFEVERVALDEPMDGIIDGRGFDLLYGRNKRDVYRLDPVTGDLVEFRLQNPLLSLHLAPTEEFAIAFTAEGGVGGRPGMEVLDLRDDRGHAYPFLLEGVGIDVAFTIDENALLHALVLQSGQDYLYELDLYGGLARQIELSEPPVAIGTLAEGGFYVTHDDPLGLVSLLVDPASDDVETIAGFGTLGLFDDVDFVVAPGEEE